MTRMTREEAAEILDGRNIVDRAAYLEALEVAAKALCESAALRAQQAPTKLDRSRWKGCEYCRDIPKSILKGFCFSCGRPLTEEAWAELERRIGGNDGTYD